MHALLDGTVFLALLCYFISKVVISLLRVEEGKVGLAQEKIRSNTVQYPSITLCFNPVKRVNITTLTSGEDDGVMNVTDVLVSLSFGGIVDDR